MSEHQGLLDADEAATLLAVKRGTIYDWASRGLLPHVRILAGKRRPVVRFRRDDLVAFLAEKTVLPVPAEKPRSSRS